MCLIECKERHLSLWDQRTANVYRARSKIMDHNYALILVYHVISHFCINQTYSLCRAYRQLRARRALSIFKDLLLRTRRALSLYNVYATAPFWFSAEYIWIWIASFWLSRDDTDTQSKRFHKLWTSRAILFAFLDNDGDRNVNKIKPV